jgi:hypothetical protein
MGPAGVAMSERRARPRKRADPREGGKSKSIGASAGRAQAKRRNLLPLPYRRKSVSFSIPFFIGLHHDNCLGDTCLPDQQVLKPFTSSVQPGFRRGRPARLTSAWMKTWSGSRRPAPSAADGARTGPRGTAADIPSRASATARSAARSRHEPGAPEGAAASPSPRNLRG